MDEREDISVLPAPFSLPLDRFAFAAALRRGQGRVFIQVQRHGVVGYEDLLVAAALEDQSFRPGLEPARGPWIAELALAADRSEMIEDACGSANAGEDQSSAAVDARHRRRVLAALARSGSQRALDYLIEGLRLDRGEAEILGAAELVDLAGARAVVAIAELLGHELGPEDRVWPTGFERRFDRLIEQEGAARRLLLEAATTSPAVATYLRHQAQQPRPRLEPAAGDDGPADCREPGGAVVAAEDGRHRSFRDRIDLQRQSPHAAGATGLVAAYDQSPCSICRRTAAEILGRLGLVPDWMVEELVYDLHNLGGD
ncbi:MAG: hypothetical protein H6807_01330 [Planctomycetes bacterium]|nr:hypothetical protein [Planctomycetota bacterium]